MKRIVLATLLLVLGLFLVDGPRPQAAAGPEPKPTLRVGVVDRAVVGGYVEGITYVSGGPFKGLVAMSVGAGVWGVSPNGGNRQPRKLFDYLAAGPRFRPTGLAYWPEQNRFVVNDSTAMSRLWPEYFYLFDQTGAMKRWPVVRGSGIEPTAYSEGMAYVPRDAANWPSDLRGRFLMIGYTDTGGISPRVDVIEAGNGVFTVSRQFLLPDLPTAQGGWGSLAVLPSGDLLISSYTDCVLQRANAWSLMTLAPGEAMALTPEPITPCPWFGGEGLTALPDSRVVASNEPQQLLVFPDTAPGGPWIPELTIATQWGLGLYTPTGLAWDDTRAQFLLKDATPESGRGNMIVTVNSSLSEMGPGRLLSDAADIRQRNFSGLTYRGDLDSAVVGRLGKALTVFPLSCGPESSPVACPAGYYQDATPAIMLAPLGNPVAPLVQVDLQDTLGLLSGWNPPLYDWIWGNGPVSVSFMAQERAYAVRMNGDSTNIYVLGNDGTHLRTIPVSVSCTDTTMVFNYGQVAAFATSAFGADFLVSGSCRRAIGSVPPVPQDVGPPLLAFLDSTGTEVFTFDAGALLRTSAPTYVTALSSGRRAGDFALLDMHAQVVVFRVK